MCWSPRTSDGLGRAAFAGRDHDQQLHDIVIDPAVVLVGRRVVGQGGGGDALGAAALDNEDILVADRGLL